MKLARVVAGGRCFKQHVHKSTLRGSAAVVIVRWQNTAADIQHTRHFIHVPRRVRIRTEEREKRPLPVLITHRHHNHQLNTTNNSLYYLEIITIYY